MSRVQCVVLYASVSSDARSKTHTDALTNLLDMRGVPYLLLDGANAEHKDVRSHLFALSQRKGVYPQVFMRSYGGAGEDGYVPSDLLPTDKDTYEFIGDWDAISTMNECNAEFHEFDAAFARVLGRAHTHTDTHTHTHAVTQGPTPGVTPVPPPARTESGARAGATGGSAATPAAAAATDPAPLSPMATDEWTQCTDESSGETFWWNNRLKAASWVAPPPGATGDWWTVTAPNGTPFEYNWRTGESRKRKA